MARPLPTRQPTPHAPPLPDLPPIVELGLFLLFGWLLVEAVWFIGRQRTRALALAVVQARTPGQAAKAAGAVAWAMTCDMLGQAGAALAFVIRFVTGHPLALGGFGNTTKADAGGGWTKPAWVTVVAPPVEATADGQRAPAARRVTQTSFHDWRPPKGASEAEHEAATVGNALLRAIELRLAAPSPEGGMKGLADHKLVLRRAFLDHSTGEPFAGFVLAVERADTAASDPAAVAGLGEKVHKLTKDVLAPSLAHFAGHWTPGEMSERLFVGDRRAADSVGRAGVPGMFVRWKLAAAPVEEEPLQGEDPVTAAIRRGLRELGQPADLFRLVSGPTRDYDHLIYRYNTSHWTQTSSAGSIAARVDLETTWAKMRDPLRYVAHYRGDDIALKHDDSTGQFVLTLTTKAPAFPGDEPDDHRAELAVWLREGGLEFLRRNDDHRAFVAGLDYQGREVTYSFRDQAHLLVVGTTGSGKSGSGVLSPILQLAGKNTPDEMGLWLVDSKRELFVFFERLPHVKRLIKPKGIGEVAEILDEFLAEAKRRQDAYRGQDWTPATGDPWLLLVVEEWFELILSAKSKDQQSEVDRVAATLGAINAIARAVGLHVVLASQRAVSPIITPDLRNVIPGRFVAYGLGAAEVRELIGSKGEDLARSLGTHKGRMVVRGADGESLVVVQGLWTRELAPKPQSDIKPLINEIIARYPGHRRPPVEATEIVETIDEDEPAREQAQSAPMRSAPVVEPHGQPRDRSAVLAALRPPHAYDPRDRTGGGEPPAPVARRLEPRKPTADEVKQMSVATAARLIWRHADVGDEISQARLREFAKDEGYQAPLQMALSLALRDLAELGLLVGRSSDQRKAGLRASMDWRKAASKLVNSGVEPEHDLL